MGGFGYKSSQWCKKGSEWKEKAKNLELELQQCYKAQSRLLEQLVVEKMNMGTMSNPVEMQGKDMRCGLPRWPFLITQYHGGTNFGCTTGGPFITTSYDYDAPIDEYGLPRLPKWGHLKELHGAIRLCEKALLGGQRTNLSLGHLLEANVYTDSSGICAAFISNAGNKTGAVVEFRSKMYHLLAWSVSILPDCKNVVYNTAKVSYLSMFPCLAETLLLV
ncbi:hypothetical protein Cgig2_027351 [Carnegiea gigantea]|uniref:beta-galactosidase n=1 Tax=Carnegiea gigantea TaxID=171969 RepID=A0A9Q1K8L8_9CARY|nr:hypothetical protein Cgig2_027351 [Carnegiea gigantea]